MIGELRKAWSGMFADISGDLLPGDSHHDESHQGDLPELNFQLPASLEAATPPEARGLARDEVRLMVSHISDDSITSTHFHEIHEFLAPGDVLVINTSGTLNAALPAFREDGMALELHLSTRLPGDLWIVELRRPAERGTSPFGSGKAGERILLPEGASAVLLTPHTPDSWQGKERREKSGEIRTAKSGAPAVRLWIARLDLPSPLHDYLAAHGFPIRYPYLEGSWSLEYYQTVYATEQGSAEMPSAGRAFTPEIITRLVAKGVLVVPLLLHTGVASLEDHEFPYEEYYHVPETTAMVVNMARASGGRVVAVGTTVVRALETVTGANGITHAGEGWTDVIVTPERGIHSVNGILTGLHEPRATHLAMLETLAGRRHLVKTYDAALRERYLWHEFGDLHLILP